MQSSQSIPLHHRGGLGAWIKPRIARAFIRKVTKPKKLPATPQMLKALKDKWKG